ncbi:MAG: prepilin-type N-terminal cleavage/methylation domain-containing protein [Planctomycetota bacterium]
MGKAQAPSRGSLHRPGFSLVELLVAITVIVLLIGIMIPAISEVRSTTHRVICSSNVRQIGLGIAMYADDYEGLLPPSIFIDDADDSPSQAMLETVRLRVASDSALFSAYHQNSEGLALKAAEPRGVWDGLGLLFSGEYLNARGVFYCPAHRGDNRLADVGTSAWTNDRSDLLGNFQYRAQGPDGTDELWRIEPRGSVLVSDSLRPDDELNHEDGANTLRADLSVLWFDDAGDQLLSLSRSGDAGRAWNLLDHRARQR